VPARPGRDHKYGLGARKTLKLSFSLFGTALAAK
jgi:hypothetical protein